MNKVTGFPLKRIAVTTSTDQDGKKQTSKTTMEVTELDREATIPAGAMQLPSGYREQPLLPTGMSQ